MQSNEDARLRAINAEIARLIRKRDQLLGAQVMHVEMHKRGKMVADILFKASTIQEPQMTLIYCKAFILPWRHYVEATCFPNLLQVLPSDLPPSWTRAGASAFLLSVSRALEQDRMILRRMMM